MVQRNGSKKSKIIFCNNRTILAEGVGDLLIKGTMVAICTKHDEQVIEYGTIAGKRLYLANNPMEVFDSSHKTTLRDPMSQSKTFQTYINALDFHYLPLELIHDEAWL
jgi:hypothetical protein